MSKESMPEKPEKKEAHAAPSTPKTSSKGGHSPVPGGCHAWGCKSPHVRLNFCDEHYDHFKFGLIKKTGEHVPDYEKKFVHYMALKAKRGSQKVA